MNKDKNRTANKTKYGTAAVHLALIACGVQAGDEVCETGAM